MTGDVSIWVLHRRYRSEGQASEALPPQQRDAVPIDERSDCADANESSTLYRPR